MTAVVVAIGAIAVLIWDHCVDGFFPGC